MRGDEISTHFIAAKFLYENFKYKLLLKNKREGAVSKPQNA